NTERRLIRTRHPNSCIARSAGKNVPGRKTDVSDAAWLQQLHSYGLLRGSFRPQADIAALRAYLRQRERLVEYAAGHIQHMQKALMEMNVQLHHVVSDITGVTGMQIIRAIVTGERDPAVLASCRDVRCRASVETISAALIGNYRGEHVFALTQALELYDIYQDRIVACDRRMEGLLLLLSQKSAKPTERLPKPRIKTKQVSAPSFDVRGLLYRLLGVDLTQTHGIGVSLALKLLSSRTRRSSSRAAALLRLAATTFGRSDTACLSQILA
uniref:IS110 family transposase n=1 Tax=Kozakia baliensis TaxID=153496 RepID=UPI002E1B8B76